MNAHEEAFWRFVYERQSVWHRRNVLKQPWPWTEDPILQKYKFTNVYRELDKGTVFFYEQFRGRPSEEIVFYDVLYRLVNRVETFKAVGWPKLDGSDLGTWKQELETYAKDHSVISGAYWTLACSLKGERKWQTVSRWLETHWLKDQYWKQCHDNILKAEWPAQAWEVIREIMYCGPFIAYQIYLDLTELDVIDHTPQDWAYPGPGTIAALDLLMGAAGSTRERQHLILDLTERQEYAFAELKLPWEEVWINRRLRSGDIEHCLCEWRKYNQVTAGRKGRDLYRPPQNTII